MKIKIKINEGMGCGGCGTCPTCHKNAHSGEEARMHRTALAHLIADVKVLLNLIEDSDDLPEWLETKITKAADYMSSAAKYLAGNKAREHGQLEELSDEKREELITSLTDKVMNAPDAEQEEFLNKNLEEHALIDGYYDLYESLQDAIDEDGNTPCPQCLYEMMVDAHCGCPDVLSEAEYKGRKVKLNKRMRGDVKKFKVFVKGCGKDKSRVKKINFGDKNMKIKKNIPGRRKSFRARHKCHTAKDKCTARYWSCKAW